jgi:hypothetical protein
MLAGCHATNDALRRKDKSLTALGVSAAAPSTGQQTTPYCLGRLFCFLVPGNHIASDRGFQGATRRWVGA